MKALPEEALLFVAGSVSLGVVVAFDAERGLGMVRQEDEAVDLRFHATQIADGSRAIEVGVRVAFTVVAVAGGELEAAALVRAG